MVSQETKNAVIRQIAMVIAEAKADGRDGIRAAQEKFPGTPYTVIIEASVVLEMAEEASWREQVEATVDGELAQRAIAAANRRQA